MRKWLLAGTTGLLMASFAISANGPRGGPSINYSGGAGPRPTQGTQGYAGALVASRNNPVIYSPSLVSGSQYAFTQSPYPWTSSGFVVDNLVNQQANVIQQQAEQAKIDTRRQLFDQRRYEQMMTPTYEESRQAELARQYSQARNNPPLQSIWNGSAQNTLVQLIKQTEAATGVRGPNVALAPDLCQHLNFSSGTKTTAGTSMIQNGGSKLEWPLSLSRDEFAGSRRIIEKSLDEAVAGVRLKSPGATKAIQKAQDELSNLREGLRANVRKESGPDYMDAVGYLRHVGEALDALKEPSSARLLAAPIQAATVTELLDQMSQKGVRFTAVAKGDEAYYNSLYDSLNTYDLGLTRMTGGFRPPQEESKKSRFE